MEKRKESKIFILENPKSVISEAYRTLRTNIQFSSIDKDIKSIVITSAKSKEGKSSVASNLAYSLAESGKNVLLVDCDLRKPMVHRIFNISNLNGLTNILIGDKNLKDVLVEHDKRKELHILPSGPLPPNPAELLGSNRMKDFIDKVKKEYDMVIFDTPPIGFVTDSAIISTIVDGTIIVINVGETEIELAQHAVDLLKKVNANIIGVVLNKIPVKANRYYGYSYLQYEDYYHESEPENKKAKKK
jgi:capsular exopolysaccharide synthesis family protein